MDTPVDGDKYVRTLSHYLRHNKKRLIPTVELDSNGNPIASNKSGGSSPDGSKSSSPVGQGVRSIITPADPMAAAYSGMVNSIWSMGSAVVHSVVPFSNERPKSLSEGRDSYNGAWDGTGTISADSNPHERQLYLQAHLKAPIFPLDLYYLLYLLDRFEVEGIAIEGWDGITPRAVGDSNPRVLNASTSGNGLSNSSSYSSFPSPNASTRPESIRSFSSTALSTLTLITGWKQWSDAASHANNTAIADEIHFIHKFLQHIQGLRLVAKIVPGMSDSPPPPSKGVGKIEGYNGDGILNVLNAGQPMGDEVPRFQRQLILPLAATFPSLTHLELHKIPPRSVDGWEVLMPRLKSLVLVEASIQDIHDVLVTAVVESERRRRQRISKERNRAVWIKQEQREALKDASTISKGDRVGSSSPPSSREDNSPPSPSSSPSLIPGADATSEDEQSILNSLKMWPVLRHVCATNNSLPGLEHQDTFSYASSIVILDLSHNLLIAPPPGLIHLHNLHNLDLSFNMISSVQAIYQILGNVTVLNLRGNRLESLCGLERLWNLEKIDVRENLLNEAAEIGRLAAVPGIREVWASMNPFCTTHPKYRLEVLAVFKANGHDLLLDGSFPTFSEKRTLATMSPTSFSSTIASISVVNRANIPATSAPAATLAKGLASSPPRISRPSDSTHHSSSSSGGKDHRLDATVSAPGVKPNSPPPKLVKKKLVKAPRRLQRVVNLYSDHDEDESGEENDHHHEGAAYANVLAPPATIHKKKKSAKKANAEGSAIDGEGDTEKKKTKKKKDGTASTKKKKKPTGTVSFADDGCHDHDHDHVGEDKCNHHVHRLASLQESLNSTHLNSSNSHHDQIRHHHPPHLNHHPQQHDSNDYDSTRLSPDALKRNSGGYGSGRDTNSPRLRPTSPVGSYLSSDDEGGAEGYRRRIEAMRNEAGTNWLKVYAEMDNNSEARTRGH
ncbi:hypothetical protein B0O80DRAFT_462985 [Mortierella sp. GBAus27b]|nr:hypothetical protein BGX31_008200 [Mortierella sp. GBA43]KAI8348380.1 hypothetical protein B0O80DRAFT_462985 [Mortierella sp. GBAus27b]